MARDEEIQFGKKRPAPADPDAQPLAKRFGRLRIDSLPISARAKPKGCPYSYEPSDMPMQLDDTEHTTYIHNLEQELAELESPGLVFAPFAETVLSVPSSVLYTKPTGQELVLYTEPSSLTVPREKDNVRKAILETRARARAKVQSTHTSPRCAGSTSIKSESTKSESIKSKSTEEKEFDEEYDAMDID